MGVVCAYSIDGVSNFIKFAVYEARVCEISCILLWAYERRMKWQAEMMAEMESLWKVKEEQVEQDTMRGLMVAVFDVVGHLEWRPASADTVGSNQSSGKLHF